MKPQYEKYFYLAIYCFDEFLLNDDAEFIIQFIKQFNIYIVNICQ